MMLMTPGLTDRSIEPLIVDHHDASRVGLAALLRRQPWVSRCLMARDSDEAKALARRHRPDVAILDVSNAGPFIASATETLREAHPGVRIVLTSRCRLELHATPVQLGASSYVSPCAGAAKLVEAVRCALVADDPPERRNGHAQTHELTLRERTLLLLISSGATNREIGQQLHLGPDSIKKQASALYRKIGVRNRIEAASYASSLVSTEAR